MAIIECLIKRKAGTILEFPNKTKYHFKPETEAEDAPHICDVDNQDHVERLLSISEGYRMFNGTPPAKVSTAKVFKEAEDAEQRSVTQRDVTQESKPSTRKSDLIEAYKAKFEQAPPSRWSAERIEQELAE